MCTNLFTGWRSKDRNPVTGKRGIVSSLRHGLQDRRETRPCGQCMECRLKSSREMAIRCVHEAKLHGNQNTVVTLTYAPENLPANGSIKTEDAVKFAKDLRAAEDYAAELAGLPPRHFKTYGCAEYGEKGGRPHYHIILFGWQFEDQQPIRGMEGYYTSDILTRIWGNGGTQIMDLTFESAAYVARYITKKLTESAGTPIEILRRMDQVYGPKDPNTGHRPRAPERPVCVSRKGIGKEWYKEWKEEIYNGDKVYRNTKDGRTVPMQPPKYYDRRYEIENHTQYEQIKHERKIKTKKRIDKIKNEIINGNTTNAMNQGIGSRDLADKECKEASWKLLKRGYESET